MANKERNKRSARQARAQKRAAQEGVQVAAATPAADKGAKAAKAAPSQAESSRKRNKEALAKGVKPGPLAGVRSYLGAVRSEMHRVVWPSQGELRNYSVAVIIMLIVFGVAVWLVDTGFVALLVGFTSLRG